ncbi:hypothetical protein ABZ883_04630 [Streptomyces sp. NPDC046977]|uniref:hypothetical protein n=1 Tax=Streptomyces sp. NPDC046977 TaxID=3154703 RepID=UPI0033FF10CE
MPGIPHVDYDDPRILQLAIARTQVPDADDLPIGPAWNDLADAQPLLRTQARAYLRAAIQAGLIANTALPDDDIPFEALRWAIHHTLTTQFVRPRRTDPDHYAVAIRELTPDGEFYAWHGVPLAVAARIAASLLRGHHRPDPTAITPQIARDVLAHYGHTGYGHGPGSHAGHMISAIETADPKSRSLLALTHGPYVEAVRLAREVEDGTEQLARIAREESPAAPK